jgi:hypothetical protein
MWLSMKHCGNLIGPGEIPHFWLKLEGVRLHFFFLRFKSAQALDYLGSFDLGSFKSGFLDPELTQFGLRTILLVDNRYTFILHLCNIRFRENLKEVKLIVLDLENWPLSWSFATFSSVLARSLLAALSCAGAAIVSLKSDSSFVTAWGSFYPVIILKWILHK